MPQEKLSATEIDSLTIKTNDEIGHNPSPLGKAAQKSKDQLLEEYGIENKRKADENKALKADNERMQAQIESQLETQQSILEELKAIKNPNINQQNAMNQTRANIDSLADELLQRDDTQGWVRLSERTAEKVASERDMQQGNWYLEDMAYEMNTPIKDLVKNLRPYADKYQNMSPLRRNQLALREWKTDNEKLSKLSEREKRIEEREIQEKLMREGRGRIPIDKEKSDAWDQAVSSGDRKGKARAVIDMIGTQTIVNPSR